MVGLYASYPVHWNVNKPTQRGCCSYRYAREASTSPPKSFIHQTYVENVRQASKPRFSCITLSGLRTPNRRSLFALLAKRSEDLVIHDQTDDRNHLHLNTILPP